MADDLERWLWNEPIEARSAGPVERAVKWVRRHPAWSIAIGLACVVFVVTAVGWRITSSALKRADSSLYRSLIALAEREWSAGAVFNAREALSKCPPDRRGWEWEYARRLCYITPGHLANGVSAVQIHKSRTCNKLSPSRPPRGVPGWPLTPAQPPATAYPSQIFFRNCSPICRFYAL